MTRRTAWIALKNLVIYKARCYMLGLQQTRSQGLFSSRPLERDEERPWERDWDCNDFYIEKQSDDFMIGKLNISRPWLKMTTRQPCATADHVKTTGHNIKWNHLKWDYFNIVAWGKTDYHCKIKQTLFIQGRKPAFNVKVSSEKLILY